MGVSIFLYLDGIPGASTDDQHQGEIDIQSFSWGSGYNPTGGGSGNGNVSNNSIYCTKMADVASPSLASAAANGQSISVGVLYSRPDGQSDDADLILTLGNVIVSSWQSASASGAPASEGFTLAFEQFSSKYANLSNGPISGTMNAARDP